MINFQELEKLSMAIDEEKRKEEKVNCDKLLQLCNIQSTVLRLCGSGRTENFVIWKDILLS